MSMVNTLHKGVHIGCHSLISDFPAQNFNEAFPIGNGRIGAMVYGQSRHEVLSLNDDTLWAGHTPKGPNPKAAQALSIIRELIFEGKVNEAERLTEKTQGVEFTQPYLPAGFVTLEWSDDADGEFYERQLRCDDAVVTVKSADVKKRYFASEHAQQIVMEVQTTGSLQSLSIGLDSKLLHKVHVDKNRLILSGHAPEQVSWEDVEMATAETHEVHYGPLSRKFAIVLCIDSQTAELTQSDTKITLNNFADMRLRIALATDAHGVNPVDVCKKQLDAHVPCIQTHKNSHKALYEQISLTLERSGEQGHNPTIDVFMFNYARYLMISASREGTMPVNLQGIWNEEVMPPWWSNFTCNINLEMSYWIAEACGLACCHMALIDFVESLVPSGRATARDHFDCGGWVLCHQTDYRRLTTPIGFNSGREFEGSSSWSMWPFGSSWLCLHLFEHYQYSQDQIFLKERAYPVMAEAAEFLLDWLIDDPDAPEFLTTAPSTSPENSYLHPNGYRASICKGSAMDISITRSLFEAVLQAALLLNETTDPRLSRIRTALGRLPELQLNQDGSICEFGIDAPGAEEPHRHISQLFDVTPGHKIDWVRTPGLAQGARVVLDQKGVSGTGWAIAWKAKSWARLNDAEQAYAQLDALLSPVSSQQTSMLMDGGGVYPNMLTAHPPLQLDANFGFAAAVLDMLVQSDEHKTILLPALPECWDKGMLTGLRLPGGGQLSMSWDRETVSGEIQSVSFKERTASCAGLDNIVSIKPNKTTRFSFNRSKIALAANRFV